MSSLKSLQSEFGIPGVVHFEEGNGGLLKAVLTANGAAAEIYLHGATVTHYQRENEKPIIFCSSNSPFKPEKAIRGGVPLCFPWFGPHPDDPKKPQHGFARTAKWEIQSVETQPNGSVSLTLGLNSSEATLALWDHEFEARYTVTVGNTLSLQLAVKNTGGDSFEYSEALHTYLCVSDVQKTEISGLENTEYLDKTDGGAKKRNDASPMRLTSETDRVYLDTIATCVIHDPDGREISLSKSGSNCTVVWNPWEAKAESMPDLNGGQWKTFVCIETVNAADYVVYLKSGEAHTTICNIS